jgi:F-type H+-transporting ATPase subunit b
MSPEFIVQVSETITIIIGFVIFYWVMKKYAWGPVIKVLDERQRRIETGFDEIKRKQAEAAQLEQQYQARLHDIELEARAKIQEAIAHGREVAAELTEQGRQEATQITERAKHNIELEIAKARLALRDEVVKMTIEASQRLLREKLDEAGHRRLVGTFIDDLERQSQS